MSDAFNNAMDRLDKWPRLIRWPTKAVLNVGGLMVGAFVFWAVIAGGVTALTIAGLFASAFWRWLTGS